MREAAKEALYLHGMVSERGLDCESMKLCDER